MNLINLLDLQQAIFVAYVLIATNVVITVLAVVFLIKAKKEEDTWKFAITFETEEEMLECVKKLNAMGMNIK